jgi:perosamine synthetase
MNMENAGPGIMPASRPSHRIPLCHPYVGDREKELLSSCVDSGWISSNGPFVRQFEEMFAALVSAKQGVAVSSGTAALECALWAVGLQPGDIVVTPSATIISVASAILHLGGRILPVDVDPGSWCMDPVQTRRAIEACSAEDRSRIKVLMPMHAWGHPADMESLCVLAAQFGLAVVEDAAQAHGAKCRMAGPSIAEEVWRSCGSIGHAGVFSFYANKLITTGEGGMVVCNDDQVADRARSFRNLYFGSDERFRHQEIGFNYRMSNLQAAVGVAQCERFEFFMERKAAIADLYRKGLSGAPVQFQTVEPWAKPSPWMIAVVIDPETGLDSATVRKKLADQNIESQSFFLGLHAQPVLMGRPDVILPPGIEYPVTDSLYRQGLYLPSGVNLTEVDIQTVCQAVIEIVNG